MRDTVITLLFDIGMSPHYAGYRYLVYAICDVLQNNIIFSMMKLYKKIADEFDCTPYAAERCIRTAITSCWEYGNQDKLLETFKKAVPAMHILLLLLRSIFN